MDVNPRPLLLVLMPTRGAMTIETHLALTANMDGLAYVFCHVARKSASEARNELAQIALARLRQCDENAAGQFALWVDSDSWWPKGTILRMIQQMTMDRRFEIVFGYHSERRPHAYPQAVRIDSSRFEPPVSPCGLEEVGNAGFHFALMRGDVLESIDSNPFDRIGINSEDTSFCVRARHQGIRLAMDFSSPVAHIDDFGYAYLPYTEPLRVQNDRLVSAGVVDVPYVERTYEL